MGIKVHIYYICQLGRSNVQSLIDLFVDIMSHQMKGIRNGRQDVRRFLFKTWKSLHECNDQINYMEGLALFVSIWRQTLCGR